MNETANVPNRAWLWISLRWALVFPSYLLTGFATLLAGLVLRIFLAGDEGTSYWSIVIVLFAAFAAVGLAAFIAPKFRLITATLLALLSFCFVPYPYTMQTSEDGEAIPSKYELIGVLAGSLPAIALVFILSKRGKTT